MAHQDPCRNLSEDRPFRRDGHRRTDSGQIVTQRYMQLAAGQKEVAYAHEFFAGSNIGSASYILFSSDREIVGFQLNISNNNRMMYAIPALPALRAYPVWQHDAEEAGGEEAVAEEWKQDNLA